MDSNVADCDYAKTIALLRKEIKAKDADLHLAACYGNKLLEETDQLSTKLLQADSRVEALEQEKHSLHFKLETLEQTVKTQNSELETLLEKTDKLQKKISDIEKENLLLQQKYSNVSKEKNDLESTQEELKLDNSSLKNKIKLLEQQIAILKEKVTYAESEAKDEVEYPDVNVYISKNKALEDVLAQMQYELEESKLKECKLSNLVKELEEAVADRDKELSAYSVEVQKAKEFSADLQCEIEVLKLEQVDVNRRGNSMFGELDDRRKLVEQEYKALSQKYNNVIKNYEANKSELTRCKGQMAILLSMTSKKYQEMYIDKLEKMLSFSKRNVESLTSKLEKTTKSLHQLKASKQEPSNDKYNYLRVMNQQAQKKIEELENELITARLQINNAENELLVSHSSLYKTQRDMNELQIENMKLKQEIKELTAQPDSNVPSKSRPNIEILPGFEPNSKCKDSLEETDNGDASEVKERHAKHQDKALQEVRTSSFTGVKSENSDRDYHLTKAGKENKKAYSTKINNKTTVHHEKIDFTEKHSISCHSENASDPDGTKRNVNCAQQ